MTHKRLSAFVMAAIVGGMMGGLTFAQNEVRDQSQEGSTGVERLAANKYYLGISYRDVLFQPVVGSQFYAGVQILSVFPNSPAAEAKLEPGNIIVRVDDKRVNNGAEMVKALNDSNGTVSIKYWDYNQNKYVTKQNIKLREIQPLTEKAEMEP